MKKRMLSILLCFVMLLGLLPGAVFAADNGTSLNETKKNITFRIEWGEHEGVEIPDYMNVAIFKGTRADLEDKDFNVTDQIVAWALVTAEDNWTISASMDKYDADGNEINYSVMVTRIGDYDATAHNSAGDSAKVSAPDSWITIANWIGSVSGDETGGFTINTYYRAFTFGINYRFVGDTPEGVAVPADSNQYKWGDSYTVASVPEVDGWTFDGWYPYYNSVLLYGDKVDQNAQKKIDTSLNNWNATYYGKWTKKDAAESAALTVTESAVAQRQVLNEETGVLEWNTVYNSANDTGNNYPLMAGDKITYTINVTNDTTAFIKGFTITDTFSGTGKLELDKKFSNFIFEDNKDGTYTLKLKDDWGVDKRNTMSVKLLTYVVQSGDTVPETTGAATKMLTNTVTVTYDGKDDTATLETPINTETFDLLVEKKWSSSGTKASSVTVQLYKNSTPVEQDGKITILTQDDSDTAYGVFKDLPLCDENGNKIIYSVKETEIDGAAFKGTEPNVDFGDGPKTCDVFETNDKTGKWYASYVDTIQTNGRVTITNQYVKNAIVVTKDAEAKRFVLNEETNLHEWRTVYSTTDSSVTNQPLKAGDKITYTITIRNTTSKPLTVNIYDYLSNRQASALEFADDNEISFDGANNNYSAKKIQLEANKTYTLTAKYTVQVGDGVNKDGRYYLTNEVEVHHQGVIYSDEVENEIEKDGIAYKIRVPIIKTLYNQGEENFTNETFYFRVYTDFSDEERFEWGYYLPTISVKDVAAGGYKTERYKDDKGKVDCYSFTMTQEDFDSLPIDEDTNLPYVMIMELDEGTDKMTYDSNSYKLYLVPEKDSGSPMMLQGLLPRNYDPAETHTYYAIADLDAWNREDSEVYDCAAEFVNYYDKQETTCYTLTYVSNGGTEFAAEKYEEGTEVPMSKIPTKKDFTFQGWYEDEALTKLVTKVTMDSDKTVYAGWKADETPELEKGDHSAYIIGYPDGTVRPEQDITRAEVATIFFRLLTDEAREENWASTNSYQDVSSDAWYNNAVSTLSNMGIIKGYPDGTFKPNAKITRAEFAAIATRFSKSEVDETASFTDVSKTFWASKEIAKAEKLGWIKGDGDGKFRPNDNIKRLEVMTLVNRVLERAVDKDGICEDVITWSDNPEGKWYYYDVQEATNSHEFARTDKPVEKQNFCYEEWIKLKENRDWSKLESSWKAMYEQD